MHETNRIRVMSLFNLEVMASVMVLLGMLFDFYTRLAGQFEIMQGTGITKYAWFMAAMTLVSLLILFIHGVINGKGGMFIWMPVLYVFFAYVSTIFSGLYAPDKLPFRFVEMFYWVAIMLLSYYAVLNLNTTKLHVALVLIILPLLAYIFLKTRNAESFYSDMLAIGPIYFLAYLMPVIMLVKSKFLKFSYLLMLFAAVLLSYKRLAILAYVSSLLAYYCFLSRNDSDPRFGRKLFIVLNALFFAAISMFVFVQLSASLNLNWSERMSTIVESGGSGRVTIYKEVLQAFISEPSYWLMGHGHDGARLNLGVWAHNDLLEILYDFGIIGLLLYLLFIWKLCRILIEMRRLQYPHVGAFAVSLVWFGWGTMFSILVTLPMWFLGLAMFWGMVVADFENFKMQCLSPSQQYEEQYITNAEYQQ